MVNPILVTQVFDTCVNAAQFVRWVSGMESNSDTVITWGDIVSGQCQYLYFDSNGGRTIEAADFMFSTGISGDTFLMSGEHVTATAVRNSATGSGSAPALLASAPNASVIGWQCGTFYDYVISVDGIEYAPQHSDSARLFMYTAYGGTYPAFYANTQSTSAYLGYIDNSNKIDFNTVYNVSRMYPDAPYIPVSGQQLSYSEVRPYVLQWANDENEKETDSNGETVYEPLTIDDIPTWYEVTTDPTEPTEETGGCCGCNCTTIYVNADGTLTISNDISGDYTLNIDNNADINLQLTAAAGAFGAGAIVIDPDANINLAAGAFGAGAFGAGAIVDPNINISGSVSVGDISGSVSVGASELNVDVSGGDINIDQSGGTNTNNYNTYNYYYGSTEDPQEPFSIDYDEVLGEDELESILSDETYYLAEIDTDISQLALQSAPVTSYLPEKVVEAGQMSLVVGLDMFSEMGILSPFVSIAVFSFFMGVFRR